MSAAQFDALTQIHAPLQTPAATPQPEAPAAPAAVKDSVASMTLAQLIDYVAKRIGKLTPKRKDALVHSKSQKNNPLRSKGLSKAMERAMGIEPTCEAWEAPILPLNYARMKSEKCDVNVSKTCVPSKPIF